MSTEAQQITVTPEPSQEPQTDPSSQEVTSQEVQPPQEDTNFAKRFATLSRQERILREKEQRIKDAEKELSTYSSLKEKIKENPLHALEHYGLTLDDLITHSLSIEGEQEEVNPIEKLQSELQSFKDELKTKEEQSRLAQEEADQKRIDEAIQSHKTLINTLVSDNADEYELINLQGESGLELVWELTEQHFAQNHEVLDPKIAADHVEKYLFEEAQKMLGLSKFSNLNKNQGSETMSFQDNPAEVSTSKPRPHTTVTHDYVTASPVKSKDNYQIIDPEESKRRAAKFLEEQWNRK